MRKLTLQVLGRILIGLALLLGASAQAAQVPFGSQQVIYTPTDQATSVFAAHADCDLDFSEAFYVSDLIPWWENTDGEGSCVGVWESSNCDVGRSENPTAMWREPALAPSVQGD